MKKFLAAAAALLTSVSLAFAVTPANAYPAGQNLRINVSATTVDPGSTVTAFATRAYPGCTVTFTSTLSGKVQQRFTQTAGSDGVTGSVNFSLSKLGIYSLRANYSCNGFSESSSVNVTSGRQTTTTVFLSSTSGSRTFTVSGAVRWGVQAVPNFAGSGLLKDPAGGKLSFRVTTDANGNYTIPLTVRKLVPGNYNVTVTFSSAGMYLGSSASNSLFKSSSTSLTGASVLKAKIK